MFLHAVKERWRQGAETESFSVMMTRLRMMAVIIMLTMTSLIEVSFSDSGLTWHAGIITTLHYINLIY